MKKFRLLLFVLLFTPACRERSENSWDFKRMRTQPRYQPYGESDGHSMMRVPPEGTVSRESGLDDERSARPAADSSRGRSRYEIFCAPCHGVRGDGESPVGASNPQLLRLSLVSSATRTITDTQLFELLRDGAGRMPSFASQLSANDRWLVIDYVRSLRQPVIK